MIKQKWIEALRGDKYQQTVGILKSASGFCCLGVLCDIVDPTIWGRPMYEFDEELGDNDETVMG